MNKLAIHEVHCTIDHSNLVAATIFEELAKAKGIKIIHIDNGVTKVSRHVMTSVKAYGLGGAQDYLATIHRIAKDAGVGVLRNKIEKAPGDQNEVVQGEEYFELHASIRCVDISEVDYDANKWFVSQSPSKVLKDGKQLYLLTARGYRTTLEAFKKGCMKSMESFKHLLDTDEHQFVEKCIMDDNVKLDEHWMRPGV